MRKFKLHLILITLIPVLALALAACEKANHGQEVAKLIDKSAECAAKVENTAVCRVNKVILLCSREGCTPIKYTLPTAEIK